MTLIDTLSIDDWISVFFNWQTNNNLIIRQLITGWDHNNLSMDNIYVVILFFYINNDFNRHLVNWRLDFVSRQLTKKQQPVDLMRSKWLVNWQLIYSQLYVTIGNRELQLYMESSMESSNSQSWIANWQVRNWQIGNWNGNETSKQGGIQSKSYKTWVGWNYVFQQRCNGQTILPRVAAWGRDVESRTRQACVGRRERCPSNGQIANGDPFPIQYTWYDVWRMTVFGGNE